jgi:hypothetical protein
MSKSTGIFLPTHINQVIDAANSSDLFINNVYCGQWQSWLIERTSTAIISCGSMGADFAAGGNEYFVNKRHLEDTHRRIKRASDRDMLLLKMGYLENYPDKYPISYGEILSAVDCWLVNRRISMIEFENHPSIYGHNK